MNGAPDDAARVLVLTEILLHRAESSSPAKSRAELITDSDLSGLLRAAMAKRALGERIMIDSSEVAP